MLERGIYLYIIYCLCYVKKVSMDTLERQVLEERDLDLNQDEDIRMEYRREENWRNVDEYGEDKIKINALIWDVRTRDK